MISENLSLVTKNSHPLNPVANIRALQILRAVAALMVVSRHSDLLLKHIPNHYLPNEFAAVGTIFAFFYHLSFGVDIFFCLSGYIMAMLLQRAASGPMAALDFMAKRAIRILPPYWAFTFLILILYVVTQEKLNIGQLSGNSWQNTCRAFTSLFLIPQAAPPLLIAGWTLIHEFLFYLLCAIIVLLNRSSRLILILASIPTLAVALALGGHPTSFGSVFGTYYLEFLMGAVVFKFGRTLTSCVPMIQCLLAIVLYGLVVKLLEVRWEPFGTSISITRQIGGALIGGLLISGLIGVDQRYAVSRSHLGRIFARIGDASFILYLSHGFVLSLLGKIAGILPSPSLPLIVFVQVSGIAVTVPIALLISEKLELPVHRYLGQLWTRRFHAPSQDPKSQKF